MCLSYPGTDRPGLTDRLVDYAPSSSGWCFADAGCLGACMPVSRSPRSSVVLSASRHSNVRGGASDLTAGKSDSTRLTFQRLQLWAQGRCWVPCNALHGFRWPWDQGLLEDLHCTRSSGAGSARLRSQWSCGKTTPSGARLARNMKFQGPLRGNVHTGLMRLYGKPRQESCSRPTH